MSSSSTFQDVLDILSFSTKQFSLFLKGLGVLWNPRRVSISVICQLRFTSLIAQGLDHRFAVHKVECSNSLAGWRNADRGLSNYWERFLKIVISKIIRCNLFRLITLNVLECGESRSPLHGLCSIRWWRPINPSTCGVWGVRHGNGLLLVSDRKRWLWLSNRERSSEAIYVIESATLIITTEYGFNLPTALAERKDSSPSGETATTNARQEKAL